MGSGQWAVGRILRKIINRLSQKMIKTKECKMSNGGIWSLLSKKTYTLNFDGTHNNQESKAGAGCIIRDSQGELVIAAAYNLEESYSDYCNVAIAEAEALKEGLILARQNNLSISRIKGDSKEVIDHVLGKSLIRAATSPFLIKIIQEIKRYIQLEKIEIEIEIVDREANKVADKLAYWGTNKLQPGAHLICTSSVDLPSQVVFISYIILFVYLYRHMVYTLYMCYWLTTLVSGSAGTRLVSGKVD